MGFRSFHRWLPSWTLRSRVAALERKIWGRKGRNELVLFPLNEQIRHLELKLEALANRQGVHFRHRTEVFELVEGKEPESERDIW